MLHYNQAGGSKMNQQLPVNVLRRGPIVYHMINFLQHKNFYDFYQGKVVDDFLNSVCERFVSGAEYKIQGYVELINYQQTEIINLEYTRLWLTNIYMGCHFNSYVRGEIKNDILKRVIFNGATGSIWIFKRFNRLQIMAIDKANFKTIVSG